MSLKKSMKIGATFIPKKLSGGPPRKPSLPHPQGRVANLPEFLPRQCSAHWPFACLPPHQTGSTVRAACVSFITVSLAASTRVQPLRSHTWSENTPARGWNLSSKWHRQTPLPFQSQGSAAEPLGPQENLDLTQSPSGNQQLGCQAG